VVATCAVLSELIAFLLYVCVHRFANVLAIFSSAGQIISNLVLILIDLLFYIYSFNLIDLLSCLKGSYILLGLRPFKFDWVPISHKLSYTTS